MSSLDREKVDTFLDRFVGYTSGTTTIGLLAVADRSGLTKWLGEHGGGTAEEVASGASLNERYVTEILSGLAAAGVLEYDRATRRFVLPAEHALFLADDTSPYFMGGWLDMLPSVMQHVDALTEAAVNGGGVPFAEFGDDMIRGIDRGNTPSQRVFLIKRWLPAIDGLTANLEAGIRVADVGCGSGTAATLIAEAYPNSEVVGYDVSNESLDIARSRTTTMPNLSFENFGAGDFPTDPSFGLITTFDVIHDLPDPAGGLKNIRQALSDDGVYLMMEPNTSSDVANNLDDRGALLYGISAMHCMTQSLAQGGVGLGAAWGREQAEMYCNEAGFTRFRELESISNKFSAFYEVKP